MPLSFEVLTLVMRSSKHCALPANRAFNHLLLNLLSLFLRALLSFDLFLLDFLLFFLFDPVKELEGTELFSIQTFVFLVDDDSHEHFDDNLV